MSTAWLAPLSAAWGAAASARVALYRRGWLRSERAPVPVISIGNLVAGGTGKTPVVAMLAEWLRDAGLRPAIVSRGYGGRRAEDPLVVADGSAGPPAAGADRAGDEPAMLARALPGVAVVVARRRAQGARLAAGRLGARCIVLDDGFQHLALRRDLDLVLLREDRPFDNGRLLPVGLLRERPSALLRADAVLLTRSGPGDDASLVAGGAGAAAIPGAAAAGAGPGGTEIPDAVAACGRAGIPVHRIRLRPADLIEVATGEIRSTSWLVGRRLVAFAGIAGPGRFLEDLRRLGADVASFHPHRDHHVFDDAGIASILAARERAGAASIVTTEKDLARLSGTAAFARLAVAGLAVLRVRAEAIGPGAGALRERVLAAARGDGPPAEPMA